MMGDQFYVKANNTEQNGWVVNTAIVRLGDGNLPNNSVTCQFAKRLAEEARLAKEARLEKKQTNSKSKKEQPNSKSMKVPIAAVAGACAEGEGDDVDLKILDTEDKDSDAVDSDKGENKKSWTRSHPSPYIAQWLVPIIRGTIANAPMTSNHHLKQLLLPYGNNYAFTKTIINSARKIAKDTIFGKAETNCKYVLALRDELVLRGNFVEVIFTTRAQAINRLLLVVIQEEVRRRKAARTGDHSHLGSVAGAKEYVTQWKLENAEFLNEYFGVEGNNCRFVQGILFATSTSKRTACNLQFVIQADAAHLRFGKYTLYSAFGITAEAHCSSIAYPIMYGNEDTESWTRFWTFALTIHPFLNAGKYTNL